MKVATPYLLLAVVLAACNPATGGGLLYDGNNQLWGTVTSADGFSISLYTNKGYYLNFYWDGSFWDSGGVYYTEPDGSGAAFYSGSISYHSKAVISANGQLYTFSDSNKDGLADVGNSNIEYSSYYNSFQGLISLEVPVPWEDGDGSPLPMFPTSREDVGLPESIALPLRIEWKK